MRVLVALVLAALPGCAATPDPAGNVAVVWNRVEEPHPVCEALSGRKNFFNIQGCSHWQAPVAEGAPRVCAIAASSATGWIVPISLLACITDTIAVSSVSAASSASGRTQPD